VRPLPAARGDFAKEIDFWAEFGKPRAAPH
jgi:hypothetical protein